MKWKAEVLYTSTIQATRTLLSGNHVSSELQSFSEEKLQIQKEVKLADRVVDTDSSDQSLLSLNL